MFKSVNLSKLIDNNQTNVSKSTSSFSNADSSSRRAEKLKLCVKSVERETNELDMIKNDPKDVIFEHCSRLRNQVDMTTDKQVLALNDRRDNLLAEIDDYERTCVSNLNNKIKAIEQKLNDNSNSNLINQADTLIRECYQYLNSPTLLDNLQVQQIIEESSYIMKRIQDDCTKLKQTVFNGQTLRFDEFDTGRNLVGRLFYEKNSEQEEQEHEHDERENDESDRITVDCEPGSYFKEIYMRHIINSQACFSKSSISSFGRQNQYVLCDLNRARLSVFVVKDYECIASSQGYFDSAVGYCMHTCAPSTTTSTATADSRIFITVNYNNDATTTLTIFDGFLHKLADVDLKGRIWVCVDDRYVYTLKSVEFLSIKVRDHQLRLVRRKLILDSCEFQLLYASDQFRVTNALFFILSKSNRLVQIGDINSGSLVKQFRIFDESIIYETSFLTTLDAIYLIEVEPSLAKQFLVVYNFRGQLSRVVKLKLKSFVNQIILKNNKLSFYDSVSNVLYQRC